MRSGMARPISFAIVALIPAYLGGDLNSGGLAFFALALAVVAVLFPPERCPDHRLCWLAGGLLVWPIFSLLPAVFPGRWHTELAAMGIETGWTWHVQPWIGWHAWLMLVLGAVWVALLFGSRWDTREGHRLVRFYGAGILLLAGLVLWNRLTEGAIPWWDVPSGVGPFPNRNQSGNLFALSALLMVALAAHETRNQRSLALFWLGGATALFLTVMLNGSRAGAVLFLAGLAIWSAWQAFSSKHRVPSAIIFAVSCLFLTAFFFAGGEALNRILATTGQSDSPVFGGRSEIWRCTLSMISEAPLRGVGLGNFSDLFIFFREAVETERRVIHPESDWLWWLAELGLPGFIVLLGCLYFLFQPGLQHREYGGRRLRSVAMVCSILFLAHSLIDVSGHRWGTVVPALLLLRLSWAPVDSGTFSPPWTSGLRLVPAGLAMVVALWFGLPWLVPVPLPSAASADRARLSWEAGWPDGPEVARPGLEAAQRFHPLDWRIRFYTGLALLWSDPAAPDEAAAELALARALEPHNSDLAYQVGRLWITRDPMRAWVAWRDALERRTIDPGGLFANMMRSASASPELREALAFLAVHKPALRHVVLDRLSDREFEQELSSYLESLKPDDSADVATMSRLLHAWERRHGVAPVAEFLTSHPAWNPVGWSFMMRAWQLEGRHQEAYTWMLDSFSIPALPELTTDLSARQNHLRRLIAGRGDVLALVSFLIHDADEVSPDQGHEWITQSARSNPLPPYLHYLVAKYYARSQRWAEASSHLMHYGLMVQSPLR